MAEPLRYDPFAEEVIQDPHPIYKRLREEAPCYHVEKWDCYALSRFEDIWNASMDADNYSVAKGTTASHLLTRVRIEGASGHGRIEIHFHGPEELDRLARTILEGRRA